jgi:hypothetical protein
MWPVAGCVTRQDMLSDYCQAGNRRGLESEDQWAETGRYEPGVVEAHDLPGTPPSFRSDENAHRWHAVPRCQDTTESAARTVEANE